MDVLRNARLHNLVACSRTTGHSPLLVFGRTGKIPKLESGYAPCTVIRGENKVGVDRQVADERMVVGGGEDFLLSLLAEQPTKIFKSVAVGFERLGAGGTDGARPVDSKSSRAY
jgi:hypothetical protein